MKRGYSKFALLSFALAVVFRTVIALVSASVFIEICFYLFLVLGLAFIGVETFKQKVFALAFNYENRFNIGFFARLVSIGLFVDFVSNAFAGYQLLVQGSYNLLVEALPVFSQCIFALLSSICFVIVAKSFAKNSKYDFKELRLFNLMPLFWIVSKALTLLTGIVEIRDIDTVVLYITVVFGILALLCFAKETDNAGGASSFSVFSFRAFGYSSCMNFISRLISVLNGDVLAYEKSSLFAITVFTLGMLVYFLEKNILAYTRLD